MESGYRTKAQEAREVVAAAAAAAAVVRHSWPAGTLAAVDTGDLPLLDSSLPDPTDSRCSRWGRPVAVVLLMLLQVPPPPRPVVADGATEVA